LVLAACHRETGVLAAVDDDAVDELVEAVRGSSASVERVIGMIGREDRLRSRRVHVLTPTIFSRLVAHRRFLMPLGKPGHQQCYNQREGW
jgi:hypothetical protein